MILKEFLVSLGLKDNMSEKLNSSLNDAEGKVSKFASGIVKRFALAGTAVVTFTATAISGIAKFTTSLVKSDDELSKFQKTFGLTREEAYKTKSALDIMGKSMEEVQLDPRLLKQFNELRNNAADLKIPDMSEGLDKVRAITSGVLALKQTAANALQWVGHSFLKYVSKPLDDIQIALKGFNEKLKKNIPDWSDKVGKALSWVVQLGGSIIRVGGKMLEAVKKVFDAIPGGVKVAMSALGGLAAFIKMGPIGKLITIISAALLLVDDFFTYLDGGDSLLGPVWKTLTDFFGGFEDSGKTALAFFSENFLPKIVDTVSGLFPKLLDKVLSYVDPFVDWAVKIVDGITNALAVAIPQLLKLAGNIALSLLQGLLSKVPKILDGITKVVKSVIGAVKDMLPQLLVLIGDIISRLVDIIIQSIPDIMDAGVELVMALVDGITNALPEILNAAVELLDKLLTAIIKSLPKIVDSGVKIVEKLVEGILKSLPKIIKAIIELVKRLVESLTKQLPVLIKAGMQIIKSLVDGIVKMLPEIVKAAIEIISELLDSIVEMLPEIIEMGVQVLLSLIDGIVEALPMLIEQIVGLIPKIVKAIVDNLPKIIDAGIRIIVELIKGIVKATPKIIKAIIGLIPVIVNAIIKNLPEIIKAGIEIVIALASGLVQAIPELLAAIPQIIGAIVEGFGAIFGEMGNIISGFVDLFKNAFSAIAEFFQNIWGGISDFFAGIWDGIVGVFSGVIDFFKGVFEGAANGIMGAFEGIKQFFENIFNAVVEIIKAPINWIIGGLNGFINALNCIKIPDWVPFVGGKGINIPNIPELEEGGVLEKGQTGFLEGNGAEAVVPLEKNTEWINKVADKFKGALGVDGGGKSSESGEGSKGGSNKLVALANSLITGIEKLHEAILKMVSKTNKGGDAPVPNNDNESGGLPGIFGKVVKMFKGENEPTVDSSDVTDRILAFLDKADEIMQNMAVVTQGAVTHNAVSNSNVSYNTTNIDNKQNYTINDSSGNPSATAEAVGRSQELHNRNLKGVYA